MANRYGRSTDGSNSDSGASWALAKMDLAGLAAIDTADDFIYLSHVHAESTATTITLAFAGTGAAPTKIICANDSAEPPTSTATTATVTVTGSAVAIQCSGNLYCYGVNWINAGTGNSGIWQHNGVREKQAWEKCTFQLTAGTGSIFVNAGSSVSGDVAWKNCDVRFGSSSSGGIQLSGDAFRWEGGSVLSGSATPAALFTFGTPRQNVAEMSGVDLSNLGTGFYFMAAGNAGRLIVSNCKLPAGWTGDLHNSTMTLGARVELHNCDSADTNYRFRVKDYCGEARDETTLVRSGGASDGTTPISWKITTNANANPYIGRFELKLPPRWNDTTGSAINVDVDILHDSVTPLTDGEVWLEVQYMGNSGVPLSSFIADAKALLDTAAAQASSSATWTTTGMSNPNKQKLSVTFTPQEKGYIQAKVIAAKSSYTLYVDPELQVS
jgi:hypothetical protein